MRNPNLFSFFICDLPVTAGELEKQRMSALFLPTFTTIETRPDTRPSDAPRPALCQRFLQKRDRWTNGPTDRWTKKLTYRVTIM